jgi:hypothetical protein
MNPKDFEEKLYADFEKKLEKARPRFMELIEEVTGWSGVDNLAEWMVCLLKVNVGRSGHESVRLPCHQEHAPQSVSEYTQMLVEGTGLNSDDSAIQAAATKYAQLLRQRFGL